MPSERTRDWLACLFLTAVAFVITVKYYIDPQLLPAYGLDPDGRQQLAFLHVFWDAVVHYGEYPMWNPYYGGGVPWAGYIYDIGLSPLAPIIVLFGPVLGFKVWVTLAYAGGGIGMYFSTRFWMQLQRPFALFSALAFMSTKWMTGQLVSGNYSMMAMFMAPLFLACFYGLLHRRWWGYLLPVLYALGLAMAKYAPIVMAFVLAVFLLCWAGRSWRKHLYGWTVWALALLTGFLLTMPKLLSLLDLKNRDLVDQASYSLLKEYDGWGEFLSYLVATFDDDLLFVPSNFIGTTIYILILAAMALPLTFRRYLPWLVCAVFATVICFGKEGPDMLQWVFRNTPVLNSMNSPIKYWSIMILMALCGMAGITGEYLYGRLLHSAHGRWRLAMATLFPLALIGFFTVDPIVKTVEDQSLVFTTEMDKLEEEPFHSVAVASLVGAPQRYRTVDSVNRLPETDLFTAINHRAGVLTWYGNIVLPEYTEPKYLIDGGIKFMNPAYRGEVWAITEDGTPREAIVTWRSYNTVEVSLAPGPAATVVLNQSFDPGWRVKDGRAENRAGLLAVDVSESGEQVLRFRYHRFQFLYGLIGFVGAFALWFFLAPFWRAGLQRLTGYPESDAPRTPVSSSARS